MQHEAVTKSSLLLNQVLYLCGTGIVQCKLHCVFWLDQASPETCDQGFGRGTML